MKEKNTWVRAYHLSPGYPLMTGSVRLSFH